MSKRPPKYCRQREKGRDDRAYVEIDGKRHSLGIYGTVESKAKYSSLIAKPTTKEDRASALARNPTVSGLMVEYLAHVDTYYGHKSAMWYHVRSFMKGLRQFHGELLADEFRALNLQELREHWIAQGWTRKYINEHVARLRRMFKWCVSRELVHPETHQSLCAVDNLRRGKCKAPDKPPVEPVSDDDVARTLEYLPEMVAVMVHVQRLCGCRPGELIRIRKMDIDRTGDVWTCRLRAHKTAGKGKVRIFCFGPKAQSLLLPRLVCGDADRLFPMRRDSYRNAVLRACKRGGIPQWSPNQLRHSAGTEARAVMGLEYAQARLGHSKANMTEHYAQLSLDKAIEVARRIG